MDCSVAIFDSSNHLCITTHSWRYGLHDAAIYDGFWSGFLIRTGFWRVNKMSKIYDIAFRMGVLFNILLWTMLNLATYIAARNEVNRAGVTFSSSTGYSWGVPFGMFRGRMLWDEYAMVANAVIYVACGFFFGFLFKFVWSKISRRRIEVK
jgi:hypothetical protein